MSALICQVELGSGPAKKEMVPASSLHHSSQQTPIARYKQQIGTPNHLRLLEAMASWWLLRPTVSSAYFGENLVRTEAAHMLPIQ